MDKHLIFKKLVNSEPCSLNELPETFGIYALWDHEGAIRYIGSTPKRTEGFKTRISNKHVTGSEGKSHKFSQAYCVGKMWRYSKSIHPYKAELEQHKGDAKLAKKLRTAFIRRHCRATFVAIPLQDGQENYSRDLRKLELKVQELCPEEMRTWERGRFKTASVPAELLDELLDEMPELRAAAERQNAIFEKYVAESK